MSQLSALYLNMRKNRKKYVSDSTNEQLSVKDPVSCVYRQLNLLSTATPAIGAWLVPIDQLKSSLRKLDMEGTLRVCAVMGCIMTEALEVSKQKLSATSRFTFYL